MISQRVLTIVLFIAAHYASAVWSGTQTIVVVGDSLSSGYGLAAEQSWVSMLADRLDAEGYGYQVVNASIAGDTSAGGLARLPRLLERHDPGIVVIELGGNDGLRGQPAASLQANLAGMIEQVLEHGATPLLVGIRIPPNYGPAYTASIARVYPALAEAYDVPLVDFLLDDVALEARLMQPDGIHPNAAGQRVMLDNVWHALRDLL